MDTITNTPDFTTKKTYLITKRYVYKEKGKNYVSVRIACETSEVHNQIVAQLVSDPNILSCCVEYLHEYCVENMGVVIPIKQADDNSSETNEKENEKENKEEK